eukprot:scaffold272702_cov18-Tisochrysis_lutea.AAC.2
MEKCRLLRRNPLQILAGVTRSSEEGKKSGQDCLERVHALTHQVQSQHLATWCRTPGTPGSGRHTGNGHRNRPADGCRKGPSSLCFEATTKGQLCVRAEWNRLLLHRAVVIGNTPCPSWLR